ncbi:MAG: hypothetical protein VX100_07255 [Pseudomonadota bacterium]|nr:hypothetical protein [Pseudomonadota bacterium]
MEERKITTITVVIAAFAIFGFILAFSLRFGIGFDGTMENWAHFGDFFGGSLSPILTFLTMIVAMATLVSQAINANKSTKAQQQINESYRQTVLLLSEHNESQITLDLEKFKNEVAKEYLSVHKQLYTSVMTDYRRTQSVHYSKNILKNLENFISSLTFYTAYIEDICAKLKDSEYTTLVKIDLEIVIGLSTMHYENNVLGLREYLDTEEQFELELLNRLPNIIEKLKIVREKI